MGSVKAYVPSVSFVVKAALAMVALSFVKKQFPSVGKYLA